MKQLFIPEIGTEIVLGKPWNFKLYGEYRNEALLTYFEAYANSRYIVLNKELPRFGKEAPFVDYPDYNLFKNINFFGSRNLIDAVEDARDNAPGYREYEAERDKYYKDLSELTNTTKRKFLEISLPKDTTLRVDRIYIRKGAKDYSSITFFARIPGVKKTMRFWAKLEDCNNIVFK